MTTAKKADKADKAAAEKGSGQGGTSNAGGTATGPGSSSASAAKGENPRSIGGTGSTKTGRNRPGHKANA
ncbi:MAG TPA: hypothetical protein VGN83_01420 [Falsiroseomonas sp.]|jgi:hypothetical protein|nr:hypothetical protein [Falsiroseomonas sp.]